VEKPHKLGDNEPKYVRIHANKNKILIHLLVLQLCRLQFVKNQ